MAWKYAWDTRIVSDDETDFSFKVHGSDIELLEVEPMRSPSGDWSGEKLERMRAQALTVVRDEWRRFQMEALLKQYFPRDYSPVAAILKRITGRDVSVRTIQAWLIHPGRPSSRKCPEWALKCLKEFVAQNSGELPSPAEPPYWPHEVRTTRVVGFAIGKMEYDERKRKSWRETGIGALPAKLAELELRIDNFLHHLSRHQVEFENAVKQAKTFEEMKRLMLDGLAQNGAVDEMVRETRADIEHGRGDFNPGEGE